jgi:hypothetical protein
MLYHFSEVIIFLFYYGCHWMIYIELIGSSEKLRQIMFLKFVLEPTVGPKGKEELNVNHDELSAKQSQVIHLITKQRLPQPEKGRRNWRTKGRTPTRCNFDHPFHPLHAHSTHLDPCSLSSISHSGRMHHEERNM